MVMGFATDYLQSNTMSQDLNQITNIEQTSNLEFFNQEIICAMLRWQQWFENPFVDHKMVKMQPITKDVFNQYRQAVLAILQQKDIDEASLRPLMDQLLLNQAQTLLASGDDYNQRLATLMTMGACEYHGFNSYFTTSIQTHGLDSRFQNNPHIEPIYRIFKRVGADTQVARFKNDQQIYVTPNPRVAYLHSKITPKWFCYFNDKTCPAYINHDYDAAQKNLFNFNGHEKLTNEERTTITTFYNQWWHRLVTPNNQKIAVMPMFRDPKVLQSKIKFNQIYLEKMGAEALLKGTMYLTYENIYQQPIAPELIHIIDLPNQITHTQKLSQIQNTFSTADLKTDSQTDKSQLTSA